jgi:hypothetical protein
MNHTFVSTIRAQIIGTTCSALGVTAHGAAPVFALVEAGHDPATPLEALGVARSFAFASARSGKARRSRFRTVRTAGRGSDAGEIGRKPWRSLAHSLNRLRGPRLAIQARP